MKPRAGPADALGFAVLALLGIVAAGGAARGPGGVVLLGSPGWVAVAAVVAVVAVLLAVCGGTAGRGLVGLGAPLLLLVAGGAALPGAAALTGPPLAALALAGTVLAVWRAAPRPPGWLLLPALFAVYSGVAFRTQLQVGAEGDEPHYLMVAESLLRDHDLALDQDYEDVARWAPFYRKAGLEPHYRVRGREGVIYSLHAVGLSLLVLPAWAAGGYPAVCFFMALLAAWLVREIRELLRAGGVAPGLAEGAAWLIGLSPPVIHYAGLVFTEIPAALAAAFVMRRGLAAAGWTTRAGAGAGLVLSLLPWLNVRYAALLAVLAAFALLGRPALRAAAAFVAPLLASAIALAGYHYALYGFFDPRRVYGVRPELSRATLAEGLPGLLLDQEFGLFVYAPVFVLALTGLAELARARPRLGLAAASLVAVTLALAGSWHMWRGGFNPPARFLVPVVPALALGVAFSLRRGPGAAAALLCGWGLFAGLAGGAEPRLVHRDRDGGAPLFRELSGAEEWTRLLPGYVLSDPGRHHLAGLWFATLLLAAVPWRGARWPMAARTAGASLGLLAAAGVAGRIAVARTADRDAVRLLGRPALELPGWRPISPATGTWGPSALDWGPTYESHRFPSGAALGRRLGLAPGSYTIEVRAGDVLGGSHPVLRVTPDRGVPRSARLERTPSGFSGVFVVFAGQGPVSLWIAGGPPFVLNAVELRGSTIPAAAGLIPERGRGGIMNMKKQVLAVVGVLAVAGLAFAQAPPQERQRGQRPAGGPQAHMGMQGPARMAEALGLTDQQKAQIEKLRADQQRAAIKRRADGQLAKLDLHELLKASTVDEKAVALRVKELTDLHGAAIKARVDHLLAMKKILTPEQWEKAKQMHANRPGAGRGAGMGRRMMRGPRPGGPGFGPGGDDLEDDGPIDDGLVG